MTPNSKMSIFEVSQFKNQKQHFYNASQEFLKDGVIVFPSSLSNDMNAFLSS